MQQASGRVCPAFNDNLPPVLAARLATAMAALRDVKLPDVRGRSGLATAFASFRLALLAQQVSSGPGGRRGGQSGRAVKAAAARLAAEPCASAYEYALKALAAHALAHFCIALAAKNHDPVGLIGDAEAVAQLMSGLAADGMNLSFVRENCEGNA
ncbi:hypothetical protein [Acidocella sp.]|uniref:hypothetical protein n=1 Tax=Acidocella sp. TaxID=50710 RepID=UPI001796CD1A|nr:hypothetical protein [Acidocella sp.]NNM56311.1 hypothetical protein [Acidocella sp.]